MVEQEHAARRLPVAPGATRLLVVGLGRARQLVVHDQPHVALVDAHAERVGRHHDAHLVAHPGVLHLGALFVAEAGVIGARRHARLAQRRGHLRRLLARGGVDDRRRAARLGRGEQR